MKYFEKLVLLFVFVTLTSCGAMLNQPYNVQEARTGELTGKNNALSNLPKASDKVVVGVYNFRDQTGQFKLTDVGSSFSTAVSQGTTAILLKALEDSEWFRPIERENLNNLLNERSIIEKTRRDYTPAGQQPQKLKPLLFAGILLEGGVVSYDTNILTGGAGARYFGAGGSVSYRQDRITVYLRAISTSTGEVLKTVYVSKTILSQGADAGIFRFVKFERLLEAEMGFTKNEPAELAVKEAIEKAVVDLVYEGIKDNLWNMEGEEDDVIGVLETYEREKAAEEALGLYERDFHSSTQKHSMKVAAGAVLVDGDYDTREPDFNVQLGYKYHFSDQLRANLDLNFFRLNSTPQNRKLWVGQNLNLEYRLLKKDKFSPYVFGGIGALTFVDAKETKYLQHLNSFLKFQYGGGLEYHINNDLVLFANTSYHFVMSDKVDSIIYGDRDDNYLSFLLGVNYNLGF
ncbi:putative assembly or transport protein for curli synthesis [unidentified eubacterium SCB49]|nr:putative assembly or transport protein for curli synthesis [unidentified eubacterium SCB49]